MELLTVFKGEEHLQVGSQDNFARAMALLGVIHKENPSNSPAVSLYGLKVIENETVPKDLAILVSVKGEIIKTFKLGV